MDKKKVRTVVTERGVFQISYYSKVTPIEEDVFKFNKDEERYLVESRAYAICNEFEVRLDPFTHERLVRGQVSGVVRRDSNFRKLSLRNNEEFEVKYEPIDINFDNVNLAIATKLEVNVKETTLEEAVKECESNAITELIEYIENNSEKINYRITCGSIKSDGELETQDGTRLLRNCVCPRCRYPVFGTQDTELKCIMCEESFEYKDSLIVSPGEYDYRYNITKRTLYEVLKEVES